MHRSIRRLGFLAIALPGLALAQQPVDYSQVEIKTTQLAPDFHVLEGQGGAISVLSGPEGILLVDSQYAQLTDKLVAAIRRISPAPIRFLVNTHLHGDHTGGNENFAKLGVTIFSREQLRARMERPAPAAGGAAGVVVSSWALPVATYDQPIFIRLNGEVVNLIPIRAAHTDGDTLIAFTKHDILAVGDYYRGIGFPRIDRGNGGTLAGLIAGFNETINRAGPNTKVVPGHGPVTDRNALIAQRDLIIAVRDRMAPLVAQGRTVEEVLAAKLTAPYEEKIPQGAQTAEQFIRWLYAELKGG
jgi:glyoxylase-like metal-dependent hydrolase (beta-lactamase superfamily II)